MDKPLSMNLSNNSTKNSRTHKKQSQNECCVDTNSSSSHKNRHLGHKSLVSHQMNHPKLQRFDSADLLVEY